MSQMDAPNYQRANTCEDCAYYQEIGGKCELYDFFTSTDTICDSYEWGV